MAEKELLERLDQLHEKNDHKTILWEISRLPEDVRRDYQVQSRKGRALGNLGEYGQALRTLTPLRPEGESDPLWWYRMGCSLFCLDREREAAEYFTRAMELGDDEVKADCRKLMEMMGNGSGLNKKGDAGQSGKGKKW